MATKEKVVSPAFSLKGWQLLEWFKGNWKTIKELIKVGLPIVIGWTATHNPALTGIITLGGKFILDVGEYYIKERIE